MLSLAELQLQTGRLAEAGETVSQAIDLATRLDEKLALSTAHQLMGQVYEREGKHRLADREFTTAIGLLDGESAAQRLAESHAAFAEVLEARGQAAQARKHWKEAANLALERETGAGRLKAF
jgi:tetratricopeptide (TPR) repeat protein